MLSVSVMEWEEAETVGSGWREETDCGELGGKEHRLWGIVWGVKGKGQTLGNGWEGQRLWGTEGEHAGGRGQNGFKRRK